MKKLLLATTAVAGTVLLSQAALAKMDVTVGGYLEFAAGFFDDNSPAAYASHRDFRVEDEVMFRAEGKTNDNMTYAAEIQLQNKAEGVVNGVAVDEAFLALSGSWGKVEAGDVYGPIKNMTLSAPTVGFHQIDNDSKIGANYSDFFSTIYSGQIPGVRPVEDETDTKITYYTPEWNGLQVGFSYAPQQSRGQNFAFVSTDYKDWWESAATYHYQFNNRLGFKLGGGLSSASATDSGNVNLTAWDVGTQVTLDNFTIGGGYVDNGRYQGRDTVSTSWNLGASYEAGPWAVAASWLRGRYRSEPTTNDRDTYQAYGAGLTYTVVPGLAVMGDMMFVNDKSGGSSSGKRKGRILLLGTHMSF